MSNMVIWLLNTNHTQIYLYFLFIDFKIYLCACPYVCENCFCLPVCLSVCLSFLLTPASVFFFRSSCSHQDVSVSNFPIRKFICRLFFFKFVSIVISFMEGSDVGRYKEERGTQNMSNTRLLLLPGVVTSVRKVWPANSLTPNCLVIRFLLPAALSLELRWLVRPSDELRALLLMSKACRCWCWSRVEGRTGTRLVRPDTKNKKMLCTWVEPVANPQSGDEMFRFCLLAYPSCNLRTNSTQTLCHHQKLNWLRNLGHFDLVF